MEKTIKVLLMEPMKEPRLVKVENTLRAVQNLVGGQIQVLYPWDDPVVLVCDEDGKNNCRQLPNRVIGEENGCPDIVQGPFFICCTDEDEFASITDELAKKYDGKFRWPEMYIHITDTVRAWARLRLDETEILF